MEKKNLSSAKVYRKILEEVKDMPEEELLSSEGYYELLDKIAVSMLQKEKGESVSLKCVSRQTDETGVTNGTTITVNTWSPLVLYVSKMIQYKDAHNDSWITEMPKSNNERQLMYLANVGTVIHEFGHVMYTNFDELVGIRNDMSNGNFAGCQEAEKLQKLLKTSFGGPIEKAILDVTNVLEDCYIENCIKKAYPATGTASKGLDVANAIKFFISSSIPMMENKIMSGEMLLMDLYIWMLQIKCCLGYTPKDWEKCSGPVHELLDEALAKSEPIVQDYKESNKNHIKDICQIMDIVASLLPSPEVAEQMQQQAQQQNGNGGSSNGTPSKEDIINRQDPSAGTASAGKSASQNSGQSSSDSIFNNRGNAKRNSDEHVNVSKKASQECSEQNDDVSAEVAKKEAEKEASDSEASSLAEGMSQAQKYFPRGEIDVKTTQSAQAQQSSASKCQYEEDLLEVSYISKKCVRNISQILKKRNYEDTQKGYLYGSKFNPEQAYREDGKCFSRRLVPDATPDVAFTIMVDQSGSMGGRKIKQARKSAILFDDVCRQLNIPHRVVGHTTGCGGNVRLYNYVNFRSNDKERYSLGGIEADVANVDSVVLSGLCEEIMKRPEKSKVVIVISDGAPWGTLDGRESGQFHGLPFKEIEGYDDVDMQELNACVRYYRKKGVKVIGVAVDESETIKAIYEQGTLDCTDLSTLPTNLVKVFKKYVLK